VATKHVVALPHTPLISGNRQQCAPGDYAALIFRPI
jgi:hypothetical protein